MPEKLKSFETLLVPKTPEVRRVIGMTGYYQSFMPPYSNLVLPLMQLSRKKCHSSALETEKSFEMLEKALLSSPILVYPKPNWSYTMFTDASKYAHFAMLTQAHTTVTGGKSVTYQHPTTYLSDIFLGSQINWAALTKEPYTFYMAINNLSF